MSSDIKNKHHKVVIELCILDDTRWSVKVDYYNISNGMLVQSTRDIFNDYWDAKMYYDTQTIKFELEESNEIPYKE